MITQQILAILDGSEYSQEWMDRFEGSALNTAVNDTISAMWAAGYSFVEKRGGFYPIDLGDGKEEMQFEIQFVSPTHDRTISLTVCDLGA